MKKYIAQIGTFDVENFGDLLFPVVLKYYMSEYEIDIFSPKGNCIKPFEKEQYVYPITELEQKCREKRYSAIIIGGGDLIRCDVAVSSVYVGEKSLLFKMWALPILIGNRYSIPVLFNAPGVPFRINRSMRGMVKELLKTSSYVTVRDNYSANYLFECGAESVRVVPDTVLAIRNIFKQQDLLNLRDKLREKIILPEDGSYIVVQHNCCNIENNQYRQYFSEMIERVLKSGKNIVFMPIGYVHNDIAFLERVYSENVNNQYLITDKLSPEEMCAVLAGSAGYVGSSLHGAVVSYSYEKFAICVNTARYSKVSGFLEQIHHPEWEIKNISDLPNKIKDIIDSKVVYDITSLEIIEKHFVNMKEVIACGEIHKDIPDILNEYYSLELNIDDTPDKDFTEAKVYFDYGSGFQEESSVNVLYQHKDNGELFFEMSVPRNVYNIRIDPIENAFISLEFLQIIGDGKEIYPSIDNLLPVRDINVIVNTDPCFVLENQNIQKMTCCLKAHILNTVEIQDLLGMINYSKQLEIQALNEAIKYKEDETQAVYQKMKEQDEKMKEQDEKMKEQDKRIEEITIRLKEQEKIIGKQQKEIEFSAQNIVNMNAQIDSLNSMNLGLRNQLSQKEIEIEQMRASICWRITAPFRIIGDVVYRLLQKTYFTQCALEALKILINKGPKEVFLACGRFIQRTCNSKEAEQIIPSLSANNKDGYVPYDAEYQENIVFNGTPDVKMLAFYLPQYHTFPENDEWWGKGFTEWVNVKNGESRFEGHYQPRVPHTDIGYYCLEDIEVLEKQAKLAKEHGIYGFCFYYYWFSGKRLMEKPVDMLLEHPEIDLPFCLCWANENWTRAWDGQNKNVLIAQEYSDEDDNQFILDLKKYILDSRYIKIDGKPLIMVYNPGQIPDCRKSFQKWRECARKEGIGEILIWTCQTANNTAELLNITDCIDAEVEFPPHNMWLESLAVRDLDLRGKSAFIYNYQCLVDYMVKKLEEEKETKVPLHHGCMLAWDNAARRKDSWFTYYSFSLHSLYKWVLAVAKRARKDFKEEERFVFINAWNEWGEGTYLEPDEKFGYANINTVSKALYELPFYDRTSIINQKSDKLESLEKSKKIAVQIHMFYLETLEETIQNVNYIPYEFDCFVTTDTDEKRVVIEKALKDRCRCRKYQVLVLENRGRDVAPFIAQMSPIIHNYEYICHIHSKKTKTGEYGNEWRRYIFRHLFGSQKYLESVFNLFEKNPDVGIIMPETFPVLERQAEWGGNLEGVKMLLTRLQCEYDELPQEPVFPVGNMFWAKADAIMPIFKHNICQLDFPEEMGQVNATIAHQIERSWVYIAKSRGYSYRKTWNNCIDYEQRMDKKKRRLAIFVHYDVNNIISDEDVASIKYYSDVISDIVFVTNSNLSNEEVDKIRYMTSKVIKRENKGLDFGAWKEALLSISREKIEEYDELVLVNNSCLCPIFNMEEVFAKMENRNVDFWGMTLFPYSADGTYINKKYIPEHLQSYFTVYTKQVLISDAFWKFWTEMPDYENYIDVVSNCETQFTKILSDAGFRYSPYILESYYICQYLQNYSIPYEKPTSLVLLGNPLVKKKCFEYMNEEERVKLESLLKEIRCSENKSIV